MKEREKHVWTWPIAGYLFLGGLGSGISIVVAVTDLFFGAGDTLSCGLLVAALSLGIGSFLLIFELGRPIQFWRVFSKQKAVLTFGAWAVSLLLVLDVVYFSCFIDWFPWQGITAIRMVLAAIGLVIGCGVLMYTGVELASMKGRLLWNTPILPVLFSISGLLTGLATNLVVIGLWPYAGDSEAAVTVAVLLKALCIGFVVLTLVVLLIYVLMIYSSAYQASRVAMKRWLSGSYSLSFWGGLVSLGLVIPLVLLSIGTEVMDIVACVLIAIGGGFLRFLVVYSDDRQLLPGENSYWKHLPKGTEPFIYRNWG